MPRGIFACVLLLVVAGCASGTMYQAVKAPGTHLVYDSGGCGAPADTVRMELAKDDPEGRKRRNSNIDLGISFDAPDNQVLQLEINLRYEDGVPEFEFLGDEIALSDNAGWARNLPISTLHGPFWALEGNRYPLVPWFEQETLEDFHKAHGNFDRSYDRTLSGKIDGYWILIWAEGDLGALTGDTLLVDLPAIRFNGNVVDLPPAEFRRIDFSGPLGFNGCSQNRAGI